MLIDPRLTQEQAFLLVFGRALMTYGCPLAEVEAQVIEVAQVIDTDVEVIRLPTALLLMFFERSVELTPRRTARKHYLKVGGELDLRKLREVREVSDLVRKGYSNAQSATDRLLQIGVRLRGGEWNTGIIRRVERMRFSLQEKLMRRPRPILALNRRRWEHALKETRDSTRNSKRPTLGTRSRGLRTVAAAEPLAYLRRPPTTPSYLSLFCSTTAIHLFDPFILDFNVPYPLPTLITNMVYTELWLTYNLVSRVSSGKQPTAQLIELDSFQGSKLLDLEDVLEHVFRQGYVEAKYRPATWWERTDGVKVKGHHGVEELLNLGHGKCQDSALKLMIEDIHPALWFTYVHLHNAAAPVVTQRVKFHADLRLEKVAHLTNHIFNQGYLAPRLRSCVSWQGVCGKKIQEHASVQELLSWGEGASEEKAIRLIIVGPEFSPPGSPCACDLLPFDPLHSLHLALYHLLLNIL
ncbi:hypothetical protein HWV62_31 [Athelia sp. TMB]|nr:hypothetical protein HWV62_31 [Athelia sp. TMB]